MLRVPTPFPQVGSYALIQDEGELMLCRIVDRDSDTGQVLIAFPERFGASGNKRVMVDRLIDGTPLTDAERREWRAAEQAIAGKSRPSRRLVERADCLRGRDGAADELRARLRKIGVGRAAA